MNGISSFIILFFGVILALAIADHTLYDSIPITAIFQYEISQSLNYARDYINNTVSFLVERLEEVAISKHRDYPAVSVYFNYYSTIEDRYERVKDQLRVNSLIEITIDDGSNEMGEE